MSGTSGTEPQGHIILFSVILIAVVWYILTVAFGEQYFPVIGILIIAVLAFIGFASGQGKRKNSLGGK